MNSVFAQTGHRIRMEWGAEGIDALRDCAVLVIVDVLSFSTSTTIAVARGARIMPLRIDDERAVADARARGAVIAGETRWTLRPTSLRRIDADALLALPSPNGAALCGVAADTSAHVVIGCPRNASAAARRAMELSDGGPIGVIAAGERWGVRSGPLRPSAEDQLGAGAVLDRLSVDARALSTEASLAVAAYRSVHLPDALASCSSGRELIAAGHDNDVDLAGELDMADVAPMLVDGVLG
jgi:2-phosphosulfolactate phosphatase